MADFNAAGEATLTFSTSGAATISYGQIYITIIGSGYDDGGPFIDVGLFDIPFDPLGPMPVPLDTVRVYGREYDSPDVWTSRATLRAQERMQMRAGLDTLRQKMQGYLGQFFFVPLS